MQLLHAAQPIKMLKILPIWRSSSAARCTINSSQFSTLRRPNSINEQLLLSGSLNRTLLWNQNNQRHFSISTTITNLWITISNSTPVAYFQQGLVNLHDITGLPWWATIVLSTILLRSCITVPLTIYQNKIVARIELIAMEMPDIVKQLKVEASQAKHLYKWTDKHTKNVFNRSVKKQWTALIVRENCHPLKTMIVLWGQIPLWIVQSVALRNLIGMMPNPNSFEAQLAFTQLTMGGFGWMPNLTEIDASYILPVALGVLNLAIIEIQVMSKIRPSTKLQTYATNFFRVLSVCMVPIAATVPSGLALYWTTSSLFGLTQNLVLMSPKIKDIAGIPKTPSRLDDPYKHLADMTKERWNNLQNIFSLKK